MGLMADLRARLDSLAGTNVAGLQVARADEFAYTDPVDGSEASGQGTASSLKVARALSSVCLEQGQMVQRSGGLP